MIADIVIAQAATEADRQAIIGPLAAFNEATAGPSGYETVAILLRDKDSGGTVGGLWAKISFSWMFVELLFVPAELRGQDFGTKLLAGAEGIARAKSCVGIWLDTYSFQAPGFYLKQGYEPFATLEGPPGGANRFYYRKSLS